MVSSLVPFFFGIILYSSLPFILFEPQSHEPKLPSPAPPPPPHLESVVVTFPPDTPKELVEDCIAYIRVRGGEVGFVYSTMKGFTATADVEVLDYVVSIASDQHINIEMEKDEDKGLAEWE